MSNIPDANTYKPESFQRLEDFARAVISVPKAEADAIEKEENKQNRKRTDLKEKPANHLAGFLLLVYIF